MSLNVRIDETTHATLKELAEKDDASLQDEVKRAVEFYRRQRFFAELTAGYASLTPEERAEDAAEVELWDTTSSDGLEPEFNESNAPERLGKARLSAKSR